MTCPKCEEGTIVSITFKRTGRYAYLCDSCEALWLEGEDINVSTGHTLESYSQGQGSEYTIEELQEQDQDHQPVAYTDYK